MKRITESKSLGKYRKSLDTALKVLLHPSSAMNLVYVFKDSHNARA